MPQNDLAPKWFGKTNEQKILSVFPPSKDKPYWQLVYFILGLSSMYRLFFFFLPSYYHCIKKKNVASNPREERKPDTGKAVLPNQLYHAEPRLDFKDDSHKICINLLRSTLTGPIWQNELKLLKSLSPVALDWQQCCHHCCPLVWSQAFLPPLSHRRPFHPRSTLYFEN